MAVRSALEARCASPHSKRSRQSLAGTLSSVKEPNPIMILAERGIGESGGVTTADASILGQIENCHSRVFSFEQIQCLIRGGIVYHDDLDRVFESAA